MKNYVLSSDVEFDLDEIWEYIAGDSVEIADSVSARFFAAFDQIATNPNIGHKREDPTAQDVLFWPVNSFLIIYRRRTDTVEIVAVVRGAREIPAFLSRRGTK